LLQAASFDRFIKLEPYSFIAAKVVNFTYGQLARFIR
jgi:hypothetical protein